MSIDEKYINYILRTKPKIIGIGEATHGTKDFWEMRTEIIEYLSLHYERIFIMLENDFECMENIDNYLNSNNEIKLENTDNLNKDYMRNYTRYKIYDSPEFYLFLKNLKKNRTDKKITIHFTGVDINNNIKNRKELKHTDNKTKATIYYNSIKKKRIHEQHNDIYKQYLRHIIKQIEHYDKDRDYLMYENINFLINHYDKSKTIYIYLAHNEHVMTNNKKTGHYLKKEYKDKYQSIGLATSEGTARFISLMSGDKYKELKLPLIYTIKDYGTIRYYFDINETNKDKIYFHKGVNINGISLGHSYIEDIRTQLISYINYIDFDYILYKPRTTSISNW
jgi:erythromycin esterase